MKNVAVVVVACFIGVGVGLSIWLGFFKDAHQYSRQLSQEDRHAEIVKAKPLPKAPIVLNVKARRNDCIAIDRAEISGGELWVYLHNGCHSAQAFVSIHWKGVSPDGTIVVAGHGYVGDAFGELDPGDKEEFHTDMVKGDPRIVSIDLYATSQERN